MIVRWDAGLTGVQGLGSGDKALTRRQKKHLGTIDIALQTYVMAQEPLHHHNKYLSSQLLEQLQNLNCFNSSNSNHNLLEIFKKMRERGEKEEKRRV